MKESDWNFLGAIRQKPPHILRGVKHPEYTRKIEELFRDGGQFTKAEVRKYVGCGSTWCTDWINLNCIEVSKSRPIKWKLKDD